MTSATTKVGTLAPLGSLSAQLRKTVNPNTTHVLVLAVSAMLQLILSLRTWLFRDDWAFITAPAGELLEPHVGHWSTTPRLLFAGLRDTFGIDDILPYAIPVIVAHLAFAHLLRLVCLRAGADPWVATFAAAFVALTGPGGTALGNVLRFFQIGFIGAVVLVVMAMLLLNKEYLKRGQWVTASVLIVFSLTFSGTALPLIGGALLVSVVRHGWKRTIGAFAPGGAAYLGWYAVYGGNSDPAGRVESLTDVAVSMPEFAFRMLIDNMANMFPHYGLGSLITIALLAWGAKSVGTATGPRLIAYGFATAAVLFSVSAAFSRTKLGFGEATHPRYTYLAVALLLPLLAIAVTELRKRGWAPLVILLPLTAMLFISNGVELVGGISARQVPSATLREQFSATYDLAIADPTGFDRGFIPSDFWGYGVTAADIVVLVENGEFTPVDYSDAIRQQMVDGEVAFGNPASSPNEAEPAE